VAYLTKIGVKNATITVISMYLEQVFLIKSELKKLRIKGVRVTTVDSF
jgi:superfamily I DNA and/or RNA helicase